MIIAKSISKEVNASEKQHQNGDTEKDFMMLLIEQLILKSQ